MLSVSYYDIKIIYYYLLFQKHFINQINFQTKYICHTKIVFSKSSKRRNPTMNNIYFFLILSYFKIYICTHVQRINKYNELITQKMKRDR